MNCRKQKPLPNGSARSAGRTRAWLHHARASLPERARSRCGCRRPRNRCAPASNAGRSLLPIRRSDGRARCFRQIDRRRAAEELDPAVEAPADAQAEAVAIEARRLVEVVNVDVDDKVGHDTRTGTAFRWSASLRSSARSARRLQRLQLLSVHASFSSAAERLWMRPKPAIKRASRGVIFQNEKSASSKLIACSESARARHPWAPVRCVALHRGW